MKKIEVRLLSLLFALAASLAGGAVAQEFPARPIRIISGSSPDFPVRIFGKKFTDVWGQQVIAESIPAASGKLAAEAVARARPDGYTLLNAVPSLIITAAVQGNLPDLSTDFMPVAITNVLPFVLVVPAELPAKTVQEFIALARAKPGQLNFAATNGTFPHLAFELVKSISKTDIVHVPFKSANDMAIALAAAQVQGMIIPYGSIAGVHQAGRVRVLAVTTAQRSRVLPDVPTLAESGLPGYNLAGWNGFLAPIGTPPEVVRKLNAAVRQGQKEPEIERQLAATGNEPGPDFTPEQFGDFLKAEVAKWNKLARDAAVRIN